jgi:hypothetical protein
VPGALAIEPPRPQVALTLSDNVNPRVSLCDWKGALMNCFHIDATLAWTLRTKNHIASASTSGERHGRGLALPFTDSHGHC